MEFKPEKIQSINTLKGEHFNKNTRFINARVYDSSKINKNIQFFLNNFKKNAKFVNFCDNHDKIEKNRMANSGNLTYLISQCDKENKYSLSYLDCTGVVVVGTDKDTGQNVSFLSHQNPDYFLKNDKVRSNFVNDLTEKIDDLKKHCIPDSIDVVVFGGNKEDVSKNAPDENFRMGIDSVEDFLKGPFDNYIKSIKFLNFIISKKVGFSPVVILGPNDSSKKYDNSLNVYFDNENRRLYMLRPAQEDGAKNKPFLASQVEEQAKEFK